MVPLSFYKLKVLYSRILEHAKVIFFFSNLDNIRKECGLAVIMEFKHCFADE